MSFLELCKEGLSHAFFLHLEHLLENSDAYGLRDSQFILDFFTSENQDEFENKSKKLLNSVLTMQAWFLII